MFGKSDDGFDLVVGRENHKSGRLQADDVVDRLAGVVGEELHVFRLPVVDFSLERLRIGIEPAQDCLLSFVRGDRSGGYIADEYRQQQQNTCIDYPNAVYFLLLK